MDQQNLPFDDDEPSTHNVTLDPERHKSLHKLMGEVIIHVFQTQEKTFDEYSQKSQKD